MAVQSIKHPTLTGWFKTWHFKPRDSEDWKFLIAILIFLLIPIFGWVFLLWGIKEEWIFYKEEFYKKQWRERKRNRIKNINPERKRRLRIR